MITVNHAATRRRWLLLVLACLSLLVALAAFKAWQIRGMMAFARSFPEPSATVSVATVERRQREQTVRAPGEVVALQSLALRNELPGVITAVGCAAGATVQAGQMLFQLDVREEQARLQAVQAEAALAQLARDRYSQLLRQSASSRAQYDEANARYDMAQAQARALQAIIDRKTLRAPFTAVAGLHNWQVGQYVAADTLLLQLTGLSSAVWVDFSLPQHYAGLPVGQAVTVRLGEQAWPGNTVAHDAALERSSRSLRFRARLPAAAPLQPGMLVDVSLQVAEPREVLLIPALALRREPAGTYVYTLRADGEQWRAVRRPVTAAAESGGQVEIVAGLQAGEQVAAKGSHKLQDNLLVNPAPAGP